jgi:hypothetical protein
LSNSIAVRIRVKVSSLYHICDLYSVGKHMPVQPDWPVRWVDIGTRTKVPLRFVIYLSKATKINEKVFRPSDRFIVCQNILGHALYRGKIVCFHNTIWTSWVSNDAEFCVEFKNINLP